MSWKTLWNWIFCQHQPDKRKAISSTSENARVIEDGCAFRPEIRKGCKTKTKRGKVVPLHVALDTCIAKHNCTVTLFVVIEPEMK